MALKRVVSTDFWTDGKVVDMFSPEDKLFMLYLLTNPHATLLGIYPFNAKVAAFEVGYSVESIKVLLDRFERKYKMIVFDKETQEIAVLNWLKHSVMKGGKPVMDCLENDVMRIKNKSLIALVLNGLRDDETLNLTVKEFVNKYIDKFTLDNMDMDMDMDMENRSRIVPRIVNESSKKSKSKSIRHKYGTYENVLLSDEEMQKLQEEFPYDWEDRIERVSEYVACHGKTYKNYLATIRSWAKKETVSKPKGNSQDLAQVADEVQAILDNEVFW